MNLKPPRLISVSSMGLGQKGHQELPFMLKWFYGSFLKIPHDDKLEMERLIIGASGKGNEYIGLEKDENEQGWLEDFISEYHLMNSCLNNLDLSVCWIRLNRALAFLKKLMLIRTLSLSLSVVRPSLLTDGKETTSYRASERVPSAYTISRADVGHFIANKCLPGLEEFKNRAVVVSN